MGKTLSLEPITYILKEERDALEADQTKWHVRPLTWKERAEVQDGIIVTEIKMTGPKNGQQSGLMKHLSGTQARIAVEKGLVKVENLLGPDGKEIKYEHNMDAKHRENVLDQIPPNWTSEISDVILRMSGLMKEEEKN